MQAVQRNQRGQAAVETAITLPMLVFTMLGIIQMATAYQARILAEYAAFKAARAASVYRMDCTRTKNAALVALIPTMMTPGSSVTSRFTRAARTLTGGTGNTTRVGTKLLWVDTWLENKRPRFDTQLESGASPMKVHVRLVYFYEYRIPFVNAVMTRWWLATQMAYRWANNDPTMVTARAAQPSPNMTMASELVTRSQVNIQKKYFSTPIVTSFALRMMSDPMPGAQTGSASSPIRCQ